MAESISNNFLPRNFSEKPLAGFVRWFHHQFPSVTPDQVTITGTAMEVAGSFLGEALDAPFIARASLIGLPKLTDGVDGKLARIIREERGGRTEEEEIAGALIDFDADRIDELAGGLLRALFAAKRGSATDRVMAYLATLTNPLPSFARAEAESYGGSVPEFRLQEPFGNRFGRAVMATIGGAEPKLQFWTDLATTVSNVMSFNHRMKEAEKMRSQPNLYRYPYDFNEEASQKRLKLKIADEKLLHSAFFITAGVAAVAGTEFLIRKFIKS